LDKEKDNNSKTDVNKKTCDKSACDKSVDNKTACYKSACKKFSDKEHFRLSVQIIWALLTNSYLAGFVYGKIYQGKLKNLCVPGLNCYSCPGALGSCPIGAFQAVIGSRNYKFAFYVAGFLMFVGALFGRFVCGWLCPFGLIQDLLHKIPVDKIKIAGKPVIKKIGTFVGDKLLRKLKYVILVVFVILLPLFLVDMLGQGAPYFCKYICPAGTLEGGVPLVLLNESLLSVVGWLYIWKNVILAVMIVLSILIYRPFCKYICPLGAIYSIFNPVAVFKYSVDADKCISCGKCKEVCKMQVDPVKNIDSPECIRCGVCKNSCPVGAIEMRVKNDK